MLTSRLDVDFDFHQLPEHAAFQRPSLKFRTDSKEIERIQHLTWFNFLKYKKIFWQENEDEFSMRGRDYFCRGYNNQVEVEIGQKR